MDRPIITRAEAKAAGLKRYFTGIPCKRGHVSERYTDNATCLECRAFHEEDHEKRRAAQAKWNANNAEKVKAIKAKYRTNNRDKTRAADANWTARNMDKKCKHSATYRKKHPGRRAALQNKRRSRHLNAEGSYTQTDVLRIHDAQKGKCACCKTKVGKNYHVDHIQPLTKGGSNWPSNLQILCPSCNSRKHNKDPITFMQSLGMLL